MSPHHGSRFAAWMAVDPQKRTLTSIGRRLGISRQRVAHYRDGRSEPELHLLVELIKLTKLPPDAFLVPDSVKALRRKPARKKTAKK